MIKEDLLKLVKATSASEQKFFRQQFGVSSKETAYLQLFDFIIKHRPANVALLEKHYNEYYPGKSLDNHAYYLFRLLTDHLVKVRIDQDQAYERFYSLLRVKFFTERAMHGRALTELKKINGYCKDSQDPLFDFIRLREELFLLNEMGYPYLREEELIDLQAKARNRLRILKQLHEHYSLYEMLRFRLRTPTTDWQMEELKLNELSVISRGHTPTFEQQKLHLMFQSFYFMQTNDYKPALKVFKQLNQLFEDNEGLWNYPPYDYLVVLEGILDNLATVSYGSDLSYFIDKVEKLASLHYPEHFKLTAQQIYLIYYIKQHIIHKNIPAAKELVLGAMRSGQAGNALVSGEKYIELLFLSGLTCFLNNESKQANRYIQQALQIIGSHMLSNLNRAIRLFHLVINYQLGEVEYVSYEIRNYKRALKNKDNLFLSERLVLYLLHANPKKLSKGQKRAMFKKCDDKIKKIQTTKEEVKILKYYDFCAWARLELQG